MLTYDLFSVSPNDPAFNPDTDTLSTGNILTADASARVVSELAPVLLFVAGFLALMVRGELGHG